MKVLVLSGPNVDTSGKRRRAYWGVHGSNAAEDHLKRHSRVDFDFRSTDSEGELIEWVHEAADKMLPVVINPGSLGGSVALRDALAELHDNPEHLGFVEVHLFNIDADNEQHEPTLLTPLAEGLITGMGNFSYEMALLYLRVKAKMIEIDEKGAEMIRRI